MAKKTKTKAGWLQTTALRVTRIQFIYIGIYIAATVIFDSWNLFTHQAIAQRWTLAGGLLILNTILWYVSRIRFANQSVYFINLLTLIVADIIFAAVNVYWERGLASKAVALFMVPLAVAATLRSRSTLLATAAISGAAYSTATVRYFNQHYGESYRIELYGYIGFYCALFFVLSWLLWVVIKPTEEDI